MTKRKPTYHKEVKVPVEIVEGTKRVSSKSQKTINLDLSKQFFKKFIHLVFVFFIITSQVLLFSAFEAHIINVTAHICNYSETRTIGFWKTHPEIYVANCLPTSLGSQPITTEEEADEIFQNANAQDMADQLRAQLLAMKFNICYFAIGEYEPEPGRSLNDIVAEAEVLLQLTQIPGLEPTREELEAMKNLLNDINNLHQIRACSAFSGEFGLINKMSDGVGELLSPGDSVEITIEEPEPTTECESDAQRQCDTGNLGICAVGSQICDEQDFWGDCIQNTTSTAEVCDNQLDDDCDGTTDCDDEDCANNPICQQEQTTTTEPYCGDGDLDEGEECDDGGSNGIECTSEYGSSCSYCSTNCQTVELSGPFCGDGNLDEAYEECDDGNTEDGDGCGATCTIEPQPECVSEETQSCDTGQVGICASGTQACDEQGFWGECVQNNASTTEVCDNQFDDDCDGLTDCDDETCAEDPACQPEPYCGDGAINEEEQCDEGENNGIECVPEYGSSCSYCSTNCQTVELSGPFCGDGNLDKAYEECDDGNNVDGDGCSANCTIE